LGKFPSFDSLQYESIFPNNKAYSPLMAQMLTFYKSKSIEYIWNKLNELQFTDENFAREVMQLFTMGTKKLNIDGTVMLDSSGKSIPVYSNNDIIEYSRAWTGFGKQYIKKFITNKWHHMNILIIFLSFEIKTDRC
jgi:uncharacterized protein (DUF1800 family)